MKQLVVLFIFVISLILIGCHTPDLGSYQEDKKFNLLADEIKEKEGEVGSLERRLISSTDSEKLEIEAQLLLTKKQIFTLKEEKDNIFSRYVTSTDVPDEITSFEKHARRRANVIKREDLVLKKIKNNISSTEVIPSGYKVILNNEYYCPITFAVNSMDGGENTSFNLRSKEKLNVYLLPGVYLVSFLRGGTQIGFSVRMTIDGQKRVYQGEECFNFAYMPSR